MKLIRLEWKMGRHGRLMRVVKNHNRIVRMQPTTMVLNQMQQEKFTILKMLEKRRKQKEKEVMANLKKSQKNFEKNVVIKQKQTSIKHFCTKCGLVKLMIPYNYGITERGMLFAQLECTKCTKKNNVQMLRKATEEEIKAAGVQNAT